MADGGRTAPGTLDRRNWIRDTRQFPAEPCITTTCDRPRVALGYCDLCAAVALTNRGVLRRRLRALLVLLATDEDLTGPAAAQSWRASLENAIADCWHALDNGDQDQPEQTTDPHPGTPPEPASPPPPEGTCRHCPARYTERTESNPLAGEQPTLEA